MSDDIVFIKNENDYNEYSKLKPVRQRLNSKVKFIKAGTSFENRCLKIPWAEEPGRLQSMGSLRVRHD